MLRGGEVQTKQTHLTMPGYQGKPRHFAQTQWRGRSIVARMTGCTLPSAFLPEKHFTQSSSAAAAAHNSSLCISTSVCLGSSGFWHCRSQYTESCCTPFNHHTQCLTEKKTEKLAKRTMFTGLHPQTPKLPELNSSQYDG